MSELTSDWVTRHLTRTARICQRPIRGKLVKTLKWGLRESPLPTYAIAVN